MTKEKQHMPRGLWYEESRQRYRVRLYRNQRCYQSYFKTYDEAIKKYEEIQKRISKIPKKHTTPIGSVLHKKASIESLTETITHMYR